MPPTSGSTTSRCAIGFMDATDVREACGTRVRPARARRASTSAREAERALDGVMADEIDVDADLRRVRLVLRRLADVRRRARNRAEDAVGERRRLAVRSAERLELGLDRVAEANVALALVHLEDHLHALDRGDFPDELCEIGDRTSF